MKKRKRVLAGVAAAAAVWIICGCSNRPQDNPITTVSQSTEDEEPEDTMEETLPGEGVPVYDVELSEEPGSFEFAVWDVKYQLPVSCEAFCESGWIYDGDPNERIGPQSWQEGKVFRAEQGTVEVTVMNPKSEEMPLGECYIAGFYVDAGESSQVYVTLPGGIALQRAVEDDVTAAYGAPKDRYEQEECVFLTYEFGMNQTIELGFSNDTGVLIRLGLRNLKGPEEDEELEHAQSNESAAVEAYQAPEIPGRDLGEYIVSYDGVLYQMPVPVSEMEKNGWKVNEKESDKAVRGLEYGYVTLEKDGKRLFGNVWNPENEAVTIGNCFVTALYGDLDTTKVPITVAGEICLGMPLSDFLAAVHEEYEQTENDEEQTDTYTFYTDEEKQDYTEVTVDRMLELVRGIKVVKHQENERSN